MLRGSTYPIRKKEILIAKDIIENEEKINHHGKRADELKVQTTEGEGAEFIIELPIR